MNKPVGYFDLVWQRHAPLRLDWWIIHTWVRMLTRLMILPRRLRKSSITLSMRATSSISEGDARWCSFRHRHPTPRSRPPRSCFRLRLAVRVCSTAPWRIRARQCRRCRPACGTTSMIGRDGQVCAAARSGSMQPAPSASIVPAIPNIKNVLILLMRSAKCGKQGRCSRPR